MRHFNEIVFGVFPTPPNPGGGFHKQLGIHDFYFGDAGDPRRPRTSSAASSSSRLRRSALVAASCRRPRRRLRALGPPPHRPARRSPRTSRSTTTGCRSTAARPTGSACRRSAWITATRRATSPPPASSARGPAPILRRAGAWAFYRHRIDTFSHAVGTVRMGTDPRTSRARSRRPVPRDREPLRDRRQRHAAPRPAVNPSLTIAANALRAAHRLRRPSSYLTETGHQSQLASLTRFPGLRRRDPQPQPACSPASGARSRCFYASRDPARPSVRGARSPGAGAFGSYAEAMADSRIDAVLVATPPDSHLRAHARGARGRQARDRREAGLPPRRGLRAGPRRPRPGAAGG